MFLKNLKVNLKLFTDIKEGMAARLAKYIGIKENELPSVRIAELEMISKNIIWKEK